MPREGRARPSLPVLPGEKAWTKAEVDEVLSDLHDDRERVVRTLTAQEEELAGLMRDAGDGAGHDQADMGATSFERDQELTVVNNEREKLAQIDRALARIADGTYGICESCGNPIGKGRADGVPPCHTVPDMQATRGTSLSSTDQADRPSAGARTSAPRRPAGCSSVVAVAAYAVDLLDQGPGRPRT